MRSRRGSALRGMYSGRLSRRGKGEAVSAPGEREPRSRRGTGVRAAAGRMVCSDAKERQAWPISRALRHEEVRDGAAFRDVSFRSARSGEGG